MLQRDFAKLVNQSCTCNWLDRAAFADHPETRAYQDIFTALPQTHAHLFSDTIVYLARNDLSIMARAVRTIESIVRLPAYRKLIERRSPPIAGPDHGPLGAFNGYDFHLSDGGPKLIEINTNAGGAFLNAVMSENLRYCCSQAALTGEIAAPVDFEADVVAMFRSEFGRQRNDAPLKTVAIVDNDPAHQYLYPEFMLASGLLARHGIEVMVTDPAALTYSDHALWLDGRRIDLVYNRLVDFMLEEPPQAALRHAYESGDVVLTPNPHNHALLADKRNLAILSDPAMQESLALAPEQIAALRVMPETRMVTPDNASLLWEQRKQLFFKPFAGHAGKAVYRGDKVTRKVWEQIAQGGYIAQQTIAPGERIVRVDGEQQRHKADIRLYTYDAKVLLVVARLYQGQTTNFRTPGGGFAGVVLV